MTGGPDPRDLLSTAVSVVRPAAALARRMRGSTAQVATKTSDTDVVTGADRAVERQVVESLRRLRPGDQVLGEEYGADRADPAARVRWLLDPIDGTVNYLYGLPWYAVSLAAELDGEVVAGVVHEATHGREWTAVAGHGAWHGTRRLRGSGQHRLGQALLATGFSYRAERRAYQAAVVARLIGEVRDIRRIGSAALDLCMAAEGLVDGYFEAGLNLWDYAAGALVATEAGLTVAGLAGRPPGPRMLVAAPPALFDQLHERLVALDADAAP